MIITEQFITEDGRELVKTFSNAGFYILRNDGLKYDAAIDPPNSGRTYTETDETIDGDATEADKDAALETLGVDMTEG